MLIMRIVYRVEIDRVTSLKIICEFVFALQPRRARSRPQTLRRESRQRRPGLSRASN